MASSADNQTRRAGFTIVEVIIVLAIGGIIISLVFIAIPALNRNSRNNQRKQDVSTILQGVAQYELNHSADFPSTASDIVSNKDLTSYDIATISLIDQHVAPANIGPNSNVNTVKVYNYAKCDPNSPGSTTKTGADYSNIAALYAVESSGGGTGQCEQL